MPKKVKSGRYDELKKLLEGRRRALIESLMQKIRSSRDDKSSQKLSNPVDLAQNEMIIDMDAALVQMQSETLKKINGALRRLKEGTYGNCSECGDQIIESRLRALPFAIRCLDCQKASETSEMRQHFLIQREQAETLFTSGS
jgi:DnaK suppressor protein